MSGAPERTVARLGAAVAVFAVAGLAIALYLLSAKLSGGEPYCGPLRTCATVQSSPYSELFGIPVALLGAGYMAVALALDLAWWRRGERLALLALYGLSLAGLVFVAYLTYLELFVIQAVCPWCVAFAASVAAIFVMTAWAYARGPSG